MMGDTDITKMKVADLKKELKIRGLSTAGNKTELTERLQAALLDGDTTLMDDAALNAEDILEDEDVLNDDELDEDTKSLLDSNHEDAVLDSLNEDAVLKSPQNSIKSKSPETSVDTPTQKKIVLKRKATISIPGGDESSDNATTIVESSVTPQKNTKTSILAPLDGSIVVPTQTKIENDNDSTASDKKLIKLSELSAKERLEMRAKKFGATISSESQKLARSERFGTSSNIKNGKPEVSVDILKKRAERFGGSVSKVMSKIENLEKLQKRQARFGKGATTKVVEEDKAGDFAEKAKLRLERFKPTVK